MAKPKSENHAPTILNRRATHEYFITARLECGIALTGTEVKSLRAGRCQLAESFCRVENGQLIMHGCHIDPYDKAGILNHQPVAERVLLAHRREIHRLETATKPRGTTLIPMGIYFKGGRAKVEVGVAEGKQAHDKRATIREKELKREVSRAMTKRA